MNHSYHYVLMVRLTSSGEFSRRAHKRPGGDRSAWPAGTAGVPGRPEDRVSRAFRGSGGVVGLGGRTVAESCVWSRVRFKRTGKANNMLARSEHEAIRSVGAFAPAADRELQNSAAARGQWGKGGMSALLGSLRTRLCLGKKRKKPCRGPMSPLVSWPSRPWRRRYPIRRRLKRLARCRPAAVQ